MSREAQLEAQVNQLIGQLTQMMENRSRQTKMTMGELMDGIAFTLQAAKHADPEVRKTAEGDLVNLKKLLEQVLSGEWTLPVSRIALPRQ